MAAVGYTDVPDTQTQQISDVVKNVREMKTPTLNSFPKNSTRTRRGGEQGWQIPFFKTDYGQNSYLTPQAPSYVQPVAPKSISMYVGLAYPGCVVNTNGMLLADMEQKASLINEAQLRALRIENFMKHMNYAAISRGLGIVAVVSSVTGSTFTGTTAAQTTPDYTKGAHRLIEGVTYDVISSTTGAVLGTITPTQNGTNSATCTVTSTGSPNTSGSYVVEQGSYNLAPRGLGYLIDYNSRIFQGVDTSTVTEFKSSVVDLNGSAYTSATINTLKTRVQVRTNAESKDALGARIGHLTPGTFNVLAIQGYGARQYQANDGKATTSFGEPELYVDGNITWVLDADMDEDRTYLRNSSDYFNFQLADFGPSNRDGLTVRQNPGDNSAGSEIWYGQWRWWWNLGFDGQTSGGNYSSAYVMRGQVVNSQVNAIAG